MKHRGVSGIGVIIIILVVLIVGYVAYQIGRLQFSYSAIKGKTETSADLGLTQTDGVHKQDIITAAEEQHVTLIPEQIFVDHGIRDSFRIYIEYEDSSSIFGAFWYRKHFIIDVVKPLKLRE